MVIKTLLFSNWNLFVVKFFFLEENLQNQSPLTRVKRAWKQLVFPSWNIHTFFPKNCLPDQNLFLLKKSVCLRNKVELAQKKFRIKCIKHFVIFLYAENKGEKREQFWQEVVEKIKDHASIIIIFIVCLERCWIRC